MSGNFKKEDLRIKKTYQALINAMLTILNHKNFNQITVNDLCEEALISRATFYVHFNDKYDLLKCWMTNLSKEFIKDIDNYETAAETINLFVYNNKKRITNILTDANNETLGLVTEFISAIVNYSIKIHKKVTEPDCTILSNFCTGGILNILLLHVKRNYPSDNNIISPYLYDTIEHIMKRENK